MTQSSLSGYVLKAPQTAFDAGEPMSSYRAWEQRQNELHLTDQFCQTRINWTSLDAAGHGIEATGIPGETPTWSATYPHTWLNPIKPANLVLRVTGHDCYVRARVIAADRNIIVSNLINGNLPPAVFDTILDLSSASPTSDGYLHINGAQSISILETGWMKPSGGGQTGIDGITRKPGVCLMRLELQILSEIAARVTGVLLREVA